MINRIILAVVVGVAVTLACVLVGGLLATLKVDFAVTVGAFLKGYAGVIGLLAALWYYFAGGSWPRLQR